MIISRGGIAPSQINFDGAPYEVKVSRTVRSGEKVESGVRMPLRPYLSLLILIPDNGTIAKEDLGQIVAEINATQVSKEDLLSDKVQFYDSKQKQLRLNKEERAKEKITEKIKEPVEKKIQRNIKEPKIKRLKL